MSGKVVAAIEMRELEKKYGKAFLENSLHEARFRYEALQRVLRDLPPAIPPAHRETGA